MSVTNFVIRPSWTERLRRKFGIGSSLTWCAATLPFQVVSVVTNYVGCLAALNSPWAAALLAAGLQSAVVTLCTSLTNCASRAKRRRLVGAYAVVATLSVTFSYCALDATYERHASSSAAPLRQMDALHTAALDMGAKFNQGRTLASDAITNEIRYADQQIAKVDARIRTGDYAHNAQTDRDGEVMRDQMNAQRQSLVQLQTDWLAFRFNPAEVLAVKDPQEGYALLARAQSDFAMLWSRSDVNAATAKFQPPAAPAPEIIGAAAAKSRDDDGLLGPIKRLLPFPKTWLQPFWVGVAVLIEAIPFLLSWSGAVSPDGEGPDDSAMGDEDPADPDVLVFEDPAEKNLRRMDRFKSFLRPPYLLDEGPKSWRGWFEVDSHVLPAVCAYRSGDVMTVYTMALRHLEREIGQRLRGWSAFAARFGVQSDFDQRLIRSYCSRLEADLAAEEAQVRWRQLQQQIAFASNVARQFEDQDLSSLGDETVAEFRRSMRDIVRPGAGEQPSGGGETDEQPRNDFSGIRG